jgi:plasmid stability protein
MASLHLKNVPDHVHKRLVARARWNRRSLNSELLYLLEQALTIPGFDPGATSDPLAAVRACRSRFSGMLTLAELQEAKREGQP